MYKRKVSSWEYYTAIFIAVGIAITSTLYGINYGYHSYKSLKLSRQLEDLKTEVPLAAKELDTAAENEKRAWKSREAGDMSDNDHFEYLSKLHQAVTRRVLLGHEMEQLEDKIDNHDKKAVNPFH